MTVVPAKLALEDAIAFSRAFDSQADLPRALKRYEAERSVEVFLTHEEGVVLRGDLPGGL